MRFLPRAFARANVNDQAIVNGTGLKPARSRCGTGVSASTKGRLEHHCAREHAERFVSWLQDNNFAGSTLLHEAILELYTEMVIEIGWVERSWNPIARDLDLICTGGRKPYEWVITRTGGKRRLRAYPIPAV